MLTVWHVEAACALDWDHFGLLEWLNLDGVSVGEGVPKAPGSSDA